MIKIEVVPVDLIHHSQNSCGDYFIDGRPVEDTVKLLNEGRIGPLNPPFTLLEVARLSKDGIFISKDHRRLLCFKEHQAHTGKQISTRVRIIADVYDKRAFEKLCNRYNPRDEGRSIKVRQRPLRVREAVEENKASLTREMIAYNCLSDIIYTAGGP